MGFIQALVSLRPPCKHANAEGSGAPATQFAKMPIAAYEVMGK
jgi:hypothetical protein